MSDDKVEAPVNEAFTRVRAAMEICGLDDGEKEALIEEFIDRGVEFYTHDQMDQYYEHAASRPGYVIHNSSRPTKDEFLFGLVLGILTAFLLVAIVFGVIAAT